MRVLPHALDYIKGGKKKQRCGYHEHELIEVLESGATVNLGKSGIAEYWLFWSAPDQKACIAIMLQNASAVVSIWESNYKYAENVRRATEDDIAMVRGLYEFKFVPEMALETSDVVTMAPAEPQIAEALPAQIELHSTPIMEKPGFDVYLHLVIDDAVICETYGGTSVTVSGKKKVRQRRWHDHFRVQIDELYEIGFIEPGFSTTNAHIALVEQNSAGFREIIYEFPFTTLGSWRTDIYRDFVITASFENKPLITQAITLTQGVSTNQIAESVFSYANNTLWSLLRAVEARVEARKLHTVRYDMIATDHYRGMIRNSGPWTAKSFEKMLVRTTQKAKPGRIKQSERIWHEIAHVSTEPVSKESIRVSMSGKHYSVWIDTHAILSHKRHTENVLIRALKGGIRQMLQDIQVLESTHNSDPFYFWNIGVIRHDSQINQLFSMHLRDLCNILFDTGDDDAETAA